MPQEGALGVAIDRRLRNALARPAKYPARTIEPRARERLAPEAVDDAPGGAADRRTRRTGWWDIGARTGSGGASPCPNDADPEEHQRGAEGGGEGRDPEGNLQGGGGDATDAKLRDQSVRCPGPGQLAGLGFDWIRPLDSLQ